MVGHQFLGNGNESYQSSPILPWKFLEVRLSFLVSMFYPRGLMLFVQIDWLDSHDSLLPRFVNPWEVEFIEE